MRNIDRVILWGLPPTFCALVQRAGRAARDLSKIGEAILIVSESVLTEGANLAKEVERLVGNAVVASESLDREVNLPDVDTIVEVLDSEGIRVAADDSESGDELDQPETSSKRSKKYGKNTNIKETHALLEFASTKACRRIPWNFFFGNDRKRKPSYHFY
jgi:superfamily II DNA/RNA helicase